MNESEMADALGIDFDEIERQVQTLNDLEFSKYTTLGGEVGIMPNGIKLMMGAGAVQPSGGTTAPR